MRIKRQGMGPQAWFRVGLFILSAVAMSGASAQQMRTSAKFEVTDSGAGSYTVALQMPPGAGGLTPQINLTYNSQSGNGLLGMGWAIGGLSSITRCPRNIAEEGERRGVKNDNNDVYCLDGQKLRPVGSGSYGANGTEYRTARESYSRIQSYGSSGSGPQYLVVETRAGLVMEYGNSADSRLAVPGGGTVRTWALNKTRDRFGNAITYTYDNNQTLGELKLVAAQYSNGKVSFEYETRPSDDAIIKYDNGTQFGSTNSRLKTIRVYDKPLQGQAQGERLYREYRLTYTQSGATWRSLLTQIQECVASGACLPPLTMRYANSTSDVYRLVRGDNASAHLANISGSGLPSLQHVVIDFDGNGIQEIFYPNQPNCPDLVQLLGWDVNSDTKTDIYITCLSEAGAYTNRKIMSGLSDVTQGGNPEVMCYADLDGDGLSETITAVSVNDSMKLVASSSTVSAESQLLNISRGYCQSVDFDGDGLSEIVFTALGMQDFTVFRRQGSQLTKTNWGTAGEYGKFFVGDFNGDGKTDTLIFDPTLITPEQISYSASALVTKLDTQWIVVPVDYFIENTGSPVGGVPSCIADFNGDGRSDILETQHDWLYLSVGNGFKKVHAGMPYGGFFCGDFNGDGRADAVGGNDDIWWSVAPGAVDLLTEVTDGVGGRALADYLPLTDNNVYTKGSSASYPEIDIQHASYVVSRVRHSDGLGGLAGTTYRYRGLRTHLTRNGSLGFAALVSQNEQSGIAQETSFLQSYPLTGLRSGERTYVGSQTLERSDFTYTAFDQTNQYARTALTAQTATRWDLNGAFINTHVERFNNIDAYGNVGQHISENRNSADQITSSQTETRTYTNHQGAWLLGLLSSNVVSQLVSNTLPGAALGSDPLAGNQRSPGLLPATSTSLAASNATPPIGSTIVLTAQVTGGNAPSGKVAFFEGAAELAQVSVSNGSATLSRALTSRGGKSYTARFLGDANNAPSSASAPVAINVAQAVASIALTSSPATIYTGQSFTVTASVSGYQPSGTVTFKEGSTTLGSAALSNGQAQINTSFASAGNHTVTASYAGNTDNLAASQNTSINILARTNTSMSLSSSVGGYSVWVGSKICQKVTLVFNLSGGPSNASVGIYLSGGIYGSGTQKGSVTLSNGSGSFVIPDEVYASTGGFLFGLSAQVRYAGSTSYLPSNSNTVGLNAQCQVDH